MADETHPSMLGPSASVLTPLRTYEWRPGFVARPIDPLAGPVDLDAVAIT